MQSQSVCLSSRKFKQTPSLRNLFAFDPDLLLAFFSPELLAPELAAQPGFLSYELLRNNFPKAVLAGASTAGEISPSGCHENAISLLALQFERGTKVYPAKRNPFEMDQSAAAGEQLALQAPPDARLMIAFAQGTSMNGSAFVKGAQNALQTRAPHCQIVGGLAGDTETFSQTYILTNQEILKGGCAGVYFAGQEFVWSSCAKGGWKPFGPSRKITSCKSNILYELDGKNALEIYKNYLGENAYRLPQAGLLFPFEMLSQDGENTGLIRTILGINEKEGSLILAGEVHEGGYLRLMHAPNQELQSGARNAAEGARVSFADRNNCQFAALLISCVGRKLALGPRSDEEIEAAASALPEGCSIAGYYSYGEICPFTSQEQSLLHNQTMAVTLLGEGPAPNP